MYILKRQLFPFKKFQILSSNFCCSPPPSRQWLVRVFAHKFCRLTQTDYNETSQGINTKHFFECQSVIPLTTVLQGTQTPPHQAQPLAFTACRQTCIYLSLQGTTQASKPWSLRSPMQPWPQEHEGGQQQLLINATPRVHFSPCLRAARSLKFL